MSHAAILNPLANLGPPSASSLNNNSDYTGSMPSLTSAPQMPSLKPAPHVPSRKLNGTAVTPKEEKNVKYDADGKRIKKGELDPATMVHVPGGMRRSWAGGVCYLQYFLSSAYFLFTLSLHLDVVLLIHSLYSSVIIIFFSTLSRSRLLFSYLYIYWHSKLMMLHCNISYIEHENSKRLNWVWELRACMHTCYLFIDSFCTFQESLSAWTVVTRQTLSLTWTRTWDFTPTSRSTACSAATRLTGEVTLKNT